MTSTLAVPAGHRPPRLPTDLTGPGMKFRPKVEGCHDQPCQRTLPAAGRRPPAAATPDGPNRSWQEVLARGGGI